MNPHCDISVLVSKKVGTLAASIESIAVESIGGIEPIPDVAADKNIKTVISVPPELINRVGRLLQTLNPQDALPFLRAIAERYPARFALLIRNDVIAERMQHTKKIAELCAVFDPRKITKIYNSINALRRNVYEIQSEYAKNEMHSRLMDNLTGDDDEEDEENE